NGVPTSPEEGLPEECLGRYFARNHRRWYKRLTPKPRALEAVAPRLRHRLGDADAGAGNDLLIAAAGEDRERRRGQGEPVMGAGHAERFADPAWPGAQQPRVSQPAAAPHHRKPVDRLDGPDQHGAGRARRLADEIQAPVDAV